VNFIVGHVRPSIDSAAKPDSRADGNCLTSTYSNPGAMAILSASVGIALGEIVDNSHYVRNCATELALGHISFLNSV